MDSGSSCLCESSDPTDPTEYLEILKKKYLDRTAKLQAQQQDLERKIMKMETFIGKPSGPSDPMQSKCQCDVLPVPKVFPETPVRDMPAVPKTMTDVIQNQQPVTQQCSFFQKMMENAKSILSMKCQCPNVVAKSTSFFSVTPTSTDNAPTTTTTGLSSDLTSSEVPTRENDQSAQENVVDYEETLTDKSSRTSTCTCDFTDPSTLQDFSCSCNIATANTNAVPQSQQVSINPSSSTPQSQNAPNHSGGDPITSSISKSEKSPFKKSTTSNLISGDCSCGECMCDSSFSSIDDKLDLINAPIDNNIAIPAVSVFLNKGENPSAEVQVATPVTSKGLQMTKDTASKCVTCCKNSSCPTNKVASGKGGNLSAGIQVTNNTKNRGVNSSQIPKNVLNVGITCCQLKTCPSNQPKTPCKGKCNTMPLQDRLTGPDNWFNGQDEVVQVCGCNPFGFSQFQSGRQDGQNQCAFIGSPLLDLNEQQPSTGKPLCDCNSPQGAKRVCELSGYSLTSNDILEMQNIAELAKKEKEMKAQIEELQKREKQYQQATKNVENLVSKAKNSCCSCHSNSSPSNFNAEIDKISRELRLENQILKAELQDMKLELRHCLEKVEGPMKQKLETEKQKCECLQKDLQVASKNMLVNQDAYAREMNELKLQLCCACTNITELNQMNQRLKDEMSHLDCLCQKLEDDLIKQKVNEAETIKRLTSRKYGGDDHSAAKSQEFKSDSNLDVIARKLSKTIKELAPCEECSKLPAELAGAAKCIKELTDMVRKRKTKSSTVTGCCCKVPAKPIPKNLSEEECCSCCGPTNGAGESMEKLKTVKTLHRVPKSFVQNDESSKFDVGGVQSSYYSAKGEPGREAPCSNIGQPCFKSKGTLTKPLDESEIGKKLPCSDIGEPCRKEKSKPQDRPVQVPFGLDKGCRAPCSDIMEPVKDREVEEALKPEKDSEEKLVQVPEEPLLAKEEIATPTSVEEDLHKETETINLQQVAKPAEDGDASTVIPSTSSDKQHITELTYGIVGQIPKSKSELTEEDDITESAPEISEIGELTSGLTTEVTVPEDQITGPEEDIATQPEAELKQESKAVAQDDAEDIDNAPLIEVQPLHVEKLPEPLWDNAQLENSVQMRALPADISEPEQEIDKFDETAEEASGADDHGKVVIGEREIPFDEKRYGGEVPIDVANKAYALDDAPADLHMTTTVTGSGTLEVITEGPGGTIGTTLTYTEEGNIEVVTEMADNINGQDPLLEKFASKPLSGIPFSSNDAIPCVPDATCDTMEAALGYEICDSKIPCHDSDNKGKDKLKAMPVASSMISGPSGPEAETPYTASTTTAEGELTSKLASGSSGIKPEFDKTPDLTSSYEDPSKGGAVVALEEQLKEVREMNEERSGQPMMVGGTASTKDVGQVVADISSGPRGLGPESAVGHDGYPSEGTTSTAGELKSGEVFTPDQAVSDMEEGFIASKSLEGGQLSGTESGRDAIQPAAGEIPPESSAVIPDIEAGMKEEVRGGDSKEAVMEVGKPSGDFTDQDFAQLETLKDKDSKGDSTLDAIPLPGKESAGINWTRECACQSKDQTDQSCQCCECKTIGVTTSGDKETITEEDEEMGKSPQETLEGAKTDTDSEFVTISETTDNALAGPPSEIKLVPQDADKVSSKPSPLSSDGLTPKDIVITEELLKKHPQLANLSATLQQQALKELGYKQSLDSKIAADDAVLEAHPELIAEDQQSLPKDEGYTPSKAIQEDISIDEEKLAKHPELVGKSKSEQQQMLQELGYKPILQIAVDDDLLLQHPELVDKTPEEQELGYVASEPSKDVSLKSSTAPEEDVQLRQIDYDKIKTTSTSKPDSSIGQLAKPVSSTVPSAMNEELFQKHPQLVGKTGEEQQKILSNLGYDISKEAPTHAVAVSKEMLEKHPELQGKTDKDQQKILSDLGYSTADAPKAQPIAVSQELLQKHPELYGKSSVEQQSILKNLGYISDKPKIPEELMEKHPELQGKSMSEQQSILEKLGYSAAETRPAIKATKSVRKELIDKHPQLQGKDSSEQQKILKELGYSSAEVIPTAIPKSKSAIASKELLSKHPELEGKSPTEQQEMLKKLGYSIADAKSLTSPTKSSLVSKQLLEKHPELEGKSAAEQQNILKSLGYSVADDKQAELADTVEQASISKKLVDAIETEAGQLEPPLKINQAILDAHPELVGKPLQEQKQLLEQKGYKIDAMGEEAYSPDKTSATAFVSAPDMWEDHKSDSKFFTPQPSSKDVSVTCKAPCRTAAVPSDIPKDKPADIKKSVEVLSKEPSSKEVSISCRAPCRSAATIHSATPKESGKNLTSIGDVSSTTLTKSRTVSLQKKPSSRDDSASCKASCRAISVQSYSSKSARSQKEVKEIVAARSDTTTTSSSSELKEKDKGKRKVQPGEVPSIVSQLSDRERPALAPTRKPRNQRKRRAKPIDCMKCNCPDPCNCENCTPDRKNLNRPARSCDCPPNMLMVPPIMMQMTYSMPPTGHAANCRCNACVCNEMVPKVELASRPAAESEGVEETPKKLDKHPLTCECVDCLCMPTVKKIARTKEYPIVHDSKQVYQVKVKCDTCVNAQNARQILEQQQQLSRSRIPISTTSPNPPRVKSNPQQNEQPAAVDTQGTQETSEAVPPAVSAAESTYNSIACDCARCLCAECPDESKRPAKPEIGKSPSRKEAGPTGDKDCCCRDVPCTCEPCTVEELTRKLRDAEQKLANAQLKSEPSPSAPGLPVLKPPTEEEDEQCNCVECVCPGSESLPPKTPTTVASPAEAPKPPTGDGGAHPDDCNCPECVCPGIDGFKTEGVAKQPSAAASATVAKQPSSAKAPAGAGDEECNCNVCACPGSTSLPPKSAADVGPGGSSAPIQSCDCQMCECSPCADPQKQPLGGQVAAFGIADCDCVDCKCNPCADPKKNKALSQGDQKGEEKNLAECDCTPCECSGGDATDVPKVQIQGKSAGEHDENCDCPECACPGAEPKMKGVTSKASKFTDMPEKVPHPPDCECDECLCLEEIIQTDLVGQTEKGVQPQPVEKEVHAVNCSCPECLCPECSTESIHGPTCKCPQCICDPCDKKGGESKISPVKKAGESGDHPSGCTCIVCRCDVCSDPNKKSEAPPTAKPASIGDQPHGDNCKCVECLCKECLIKLSPLKHEEGCQCAQCVCVECLKKMQVGDSATVGPKVEQEGSGVPGTDTATGTREAESKVAAEPRETKPSDHGPQCKCPECECKPCLRQEEGDADGPCSCPVCTCLICNKKKEGPVAVPPTQSKVAIESRETSSGDHGDQCSCQECKCKPCFKRPRSEVDADELCNCPVCICATCSKKREDNARVEAGSGPTAGPHGEQCTCTICHCKPCFSKVEPDEECTCKVCTCIICNKRRAEGAPVQSVIMGDKETHSPACTCDVCQCGPKKAGAEGKPQDAKEGAVRTIDSPLMDPPPFEPFRRIDCNCQKCYCIICSHTANTQMAAGGVMEFRSTYPDDYVAPPFEAPMRIDCICTRCSCLFCNKEAPQQKSVAAQPSTNIATGGAVLRKAVSVQQSAQAGAQQSTLRVAGPAQESKMETARSIHGPGCLCATCTCNPCKQDASKSVAGIGASKHAVGDASGHPPDCTCNACICSPCKYAAGAESFVSAKGSKPGLAAPSGTTKTEGEPLHCYCPTCTCGEGIIKSTMLNKPSTTATSAPSTTLPVTARSVTLQLSQSNKAPTKGEPFLSADTLVLPKPDIREMFPVHPASCDCAQCVCQTCADPKMSPGGMNIKESVKTMDNVALVKSIQAANKENCECKEQIEEIKRTLEKIKCACSEAEFRSTQSMAQTMGMDMAGYGTKPFVKQATAFGQTMSGLKMALNNLQLKCKAKDRMIEAMTTELTQRGTPEVFDKVLDESVKIPTALDYDQADDVKSLDRAQLATNVLYAPTKLKDGSTTPCDLRCVASKGVEVRTHKHKKKKERTSEKKANDCDCSNPQIVQKSEKDCQKLDLAGFEVIDIRRITDDSLIVKWNAPKNDQVQGYDIFVNGSMASKVMSGARTSAMMHSLDLSKSVQITIYAVTKCGRVEPPAIAIYEIKT